MAITTNNSIKVKHGRSRVAMVLLLGLLLELMGMFV
jgi:hypothetical protein